MVGNRTRRAAAVATALLIGGAAAIAAPPSGTGVPRAELDALQAAVESAVARVSRPAGLMFGRQSRAYHLKGYGAVVVLAPRALPRPPRRADTMEESRAFADLLGRLDQSIAEVRDPAERRRLQETVAALRAGGGPGLPMPMPMIAPRPRPAAPRDVASMQEEAEAFRREAERAMERAEHDVLVRLQDPEDGGGFALARVPDDPEDTLPAVPPEPPAPPAPAPRVPALPPAPPAERVPPIPAFPPAPPGWTFTFEEAPLPEDLTPDRVVADVRQAIVAGLGAYRGGLALLGPDEFVVVAVDFVPRMADRSRTRTVVARARKRDLVEHRAGRLSADALHARVAFDEY